MLFSLLDMEQIEVCLWTFVNSMYSSGTVGVGKIYNNGHWSPSIFIN